MDAFDRALGLMPEGLRRELVFLPEEMKRRTEELRLRCGLGAALRLPEGEKPLGAPIGPAEIGEVLERATKCSLYTAEESLKAGYFTAEGGLRLGFGGSVLTGGEGISGFQHFSSVALRIPRQADCLSEELFSFLRGKSVLIYSAPGCGKTTLLRELVRRTSLDGETVALLDERGEIAALSGGVPGFDIGPRTDVLSGCPKARGAEMLLRAMSPEVLAMDELSRADLRPLSLGLAAGVRLYATAHARSLGELRRRGIPLGIFDAAVRIERRAGERQYIPEELS